MSTQTSTVRSRTAVPASPFGKAGLATLLKFQGYLGLLIVFIAGVIVSPSSSGTNLFLELSNQMNILRYVSVVGIMAVSGARRIASGFGSSRKIWRKPTSSVAAPSPTEPA